MTSLPGMNYSWMTLANNKQIGSNKQAKDGQFGLKDGLSMEDFQNIDKNFGNEDGSISEKEFKAAYAEKYGKNDKNWKKYWDNYTRAFNDLGGETEYIYENGKKAGKKVTNNRPDGRKIVSYYDMQGNLEKYVDTKTDKKTGTKTSTTYKHDEDNGGCVKDQVEITDKNGNIYWEKDGVVRRYSGKDKNYRVSTKEGKLEYIKAGGLGYNITWNGNNAVLDINGKECKGTLVNGEITFECDGKVLATYNKLDNGETEFSVYGDDGKKDRGFVIDKNGYIVASNLFNEHGDIIRTVTPQTGEIELYKYDYKTVNGETIKTSCTITNNGKTIEKIQYDENGDKTKQIKYDPKTGKKISKDEFENNIKTKSTVYKDDGKTPNGTMYYEMVDGESVISAIEFYNKDGKVTEKINMNTGNAFGDAVIQAAFKYLGYNEADGSYKLFDKGTGGWCADFAAYVINEVCKNKGIDESRLAEIETLLGSTIVELMAAGKSDGEYHDYDYKTEKEKKSAERKEQIKSVIERGMVFVVKSSSSSGRHVGIVVDVDLKNGTFTTIEGNSKDAVRHHTRKIEEVAGLIDLSSLYNV